MLYATQDSIIRESDNFVSACYGIKSDQADLKHGFLYGPREQRKKLFATLKPPKLECLPPTNEVFRLSVESPFSSLYMEQLSPWEISRHGSSQGNKRFFIENDFKSLWVTIF